MRWRKVTASRALPWVLAAVFLVTTLVNWWLLRNERHDDARAETVQTTSRDFLHALTTFSAKTIDGDVQRIKSYALGDFASQAEQTFSPARIAQIKSAKVQIAGDLRSVFTEDISGSEATVFGVVDETVSNVSSPTLRADVLRVELGLIQTTDGWKVNSVNILQSPGATAAPSG